MKSLVAFQITNKLLLEFDELLPEDHSRSKTIRKLIERHIKRNKNKKKEDIKL